MRDAGGYEDDYGPPSGEDSGWWQEFVVSKGYPRMKREPKQVAGQMKLGEYRQLNSRPVYAITDRGPVPIEEYDPRDDNSPGVW